MLVHVFVQMPVIGFNLAGKKIPKVLGCEITYVNITYLNSPGGSSLSQMAFALGASVGPL